MKTLRRLKISDGYLLGSVDVVTADIVWFNLGHIQNGKMNWYDSVKSIVIPEDLKDHYNKLIEELNYASN